MKKMLLVVRREYLDRVKKKSFLIGTILGPVLMGLMIFAPALIFRLSPDTQTTVSVVDLTGVVYEQMEASLTDTLDSGELKFRLREHKAEEIGLDEAKRVLNLEVEEDAIDGYLVIPADIIESGKATYYGKRVGDIKSNDNLERALSKVIIGMRLSSEGLEYSKVKGLVENVNLETMQVTEDGAEKRGGFDFVFMSSFLFIMMLYMTILMWGVAVQRSIIEEKNNRVIEVLLSSLRPEDLLFGKIFGVGAVGMTQYAIWGLFGTIMTAYGLTMGGPVAELAGNFSFATLGFFILYYLLGFLFYATMFAGIGSVCNTDQEAQQMQTPVVLCLVFTILLPMLVIQRPDSTFATVISLIPFFTPIVMFMRINVLMPPAWQIVLSIVMMVLAIRFSGMLAAKIFRTGILMYGKKPDVREILKWLKRS
jgi:ABC-2 type transport system permease protein